MRIAPSIVLLAFGKGHTALQQNRRGERIRTAAGGYQSGLFIFVAQTSLAVSGAKFVR